MSLVGGGYEACGESGCNGGIPRGENVGSATTQQAHDEFTSTVITDLDEL